MSRREPPQHDAEGSDWMDTYGDLITLVLCFFVLLYSFSTLDLKKYEQFVKSMGGSGAMSTAGNTVFTPASVIQDPVPQTNEFTGESEHQDYYNTQMFGDLYSELKNYIEQNDLEDELSLDRIGEEITLRMVDTALFDPAKADLKPQATVIINSTVDIIVQYLDNIKLVRVEGHADNNPIHNPIYPSNWELSGGRAASVIRYLENNTKIPSNKLAVAGYGDTRPYADNSTEEGRAKNRRVEFIIVSMNANIVE